MLEEFARRNNLPNPWHFTDDGGSSTRSDRSGFLVMMEEVEVVYRIFSLTMYSASGETQAVQQTADISKKRNRLAAAQKRTGELERLICKIYEDNALCKLPDAQYEALDAQYAKEQDARNAEIKELEKAVTGYE